MYRWLSRSPTFSFIVISDRKLTANLPKSLMLLMPYCGINIRWMYKSTPFWCWCDRKDRSFSPDTLYTARWKHWKWWVTSATAEHFSWWLIDCFYKWSRSWTKPSPSSWCCELLNRLPGCLDRWMNRRLPNVSLKLTPVLNELSSVATEYRSVYICWPYKWLIYVRIKYQFSNG